MDADAVVSTPSWNDFERLADAVVQELGLRREGGQRFALGDASVDLIPFGERVVAEDLITWPDGTVMSALGLDFGEMGAYLMGRDVRALARPRSLEGIKAFAAQIQDEHSTPIMDVIREEGRRRFSETRASEVYRLLRVFLAALNERP